MNQSQSGYAVKQQWVDRLGAVRRYAKNVITAHLFRFTPRKQTQLGNRGMSENCQIRTSKVILVRIGSRYRQPDSLRPSGQKQIRSDLPTHWWCRTAVTRLWHRPTWLLPSRSRAAGELNDWRCGRAYEYNVIIRRRKLRGAATPRVMTSEKPAFLNKESMCPALPRPSKPPSWYGSHSGKPACLEIARGMRTSAQSSLFSNCC